MSVNYEIKGMLARLLATEDLIVEHRKVETAQFNVQTRTLTLPMWEKATNSVYDLLVAHEVGHALFTPDEDWTEKVKIPQSFVNIVEDARIEKMIKRKYAGLAKTFYAGYKEFDEMDFFSIADEDISKMNLADRANLYFKVGNFVKIEFTQREQDIIDMIVACEKFDDVLQAAKVLYEYCSEKEETISEAQQPQIVNQSQKQNNQESDTENDSEQEQPGDSEDDKSGMSEETQSVGEQEVARQDNNQSITENNSNEVEVKTDEIFNQNTRQFIDNNSQDNIYVEIPKINIENVIVPPKEIHDHIDQHFDDFVKHAEQNGGYAANIFTHVDQDYLKFKNSAQKEVSYMVKEFECRKSADAYSRASQSKTGVLDCTKLHTYKYSEDLFKKVTVIPDGKNHGLIFILDWSGSMANIMMDTLKQLYSVIWFCKKVSIPFEVYAFSDDYYRSYGEEATKLPRIYERKEGTFHIHDSFRLMNFFNNKSNAATLEHQMKNIWRVAYSFRTYCSYQYPSKLTLSGTPLHESIIALNDIIPYFQKKNQIQKVNCIILTDGESNGIAYNRVVKRHWESEPYLGMASVFGSNTYLRDRKTGNTYKIFQELQSLQDALLKNLRDRFSDVNFIGIRLMENRESGYFIRRYYPDTDRGEGLAVMNDWKKNRSFSIKNSGYHRYFGISSSSLNNESEFVVSEDATKSQIKNAFSKSLKNKKMNKKILGEFIELIA